jgi:hypothetical protein
MDQTRLPITRWLRQRIRDGAVLFQPRPDCAISYPTARAILRGRKLIEASANIGA